MWQWSERVANEMIEERLREAERTWRLREADRGRQARRVRRTLAQRVAGWASGDATEDGSAVPQHALASAPGDRS